MSDQRTQTQVLYEVLAAEALRASSEIAKLRDLIPLLLNKGSQDLVRMSDAQLERFRAATYELTDKAKSFEEVASRVFLGISQAQSQMDYTLRQTAERQLEESRAELMRHAVTLACNSARTALADALGPVATEAAASSLSATAQLRNATTEATSRLSKLGWKFGLKLAAIVAATMVAVLFLNRALDDVWPWKFTEDQLQYLAQGKALSNGWSKLDRATQSRINALMQNAELP